MQYKISIMIGSYDLNIIIKKDKSFMYIFLSICYLHYDIQAKIFLKDI